jgi:hypothetical protein
MIFKVETEKNFLLFLREAANEFQMMIHLTIRNCNKQLNSEKKISPSNL